MEIPQLILLILSGIGLLTSIFWASYLLYLRKIDNHNRQQETIYFRMSEILMSEIGASDTDPEDALQMVNALRQTYNENLKGKRGEQMKLPLVTFEELGMKYGKRKQPN